VIDDEKSAQAAAMACCGVAIASLVPVTLFQLKAIRKLPDPPGALFASEQITTSKAARPFGIPDGALGIASFGTTLLLLGSDTGNQSIVHKAAQCKVLFDGGMAAANTVRQFLHFKKICSWCMGTVIGTAGMVYFWHRANRAKVLNTR
jgi:uncharacterized membrane protein